MQASKMLVFINVCRRNANIWYTTSFGSVKGKQKWLARKIRSPRYMRKLLSQSRIFVYVMLKAFSPRKSGRVIFKNNPPLRTIRHGSGRPLKDVFSAGPLLKGDLFSFYTRLICRDTTSNSPRLNW